VPRFENIKKQTQTRAALKKGGGDANFSSEPWQHCCRSFSSARSLVGAAKGLMQVFLPAMETLTNGTPTHPRLALVPRHSLDYRGDWIDHMLDLSKAFSEDEVRM
jgi:hypothetical protein